MSLGIVYLSYNAQYFLWHSLIQRHILLVHSKYLSLFMVSPLSVLQKRICFWFFLISFKIIFLYKWMSPFVRSIKFFCYLLRSFIYHNFEEISATHLLKSIWSKYFNMKQNLLCLKLFNRLSRCRYKLKWWYWLSMKSIEYFLLMKHDKIISHFLKLLI